MNCWVSVLSSLHGQFCSRPKNVSYIIRTYLDKAISSSLCFNFVVIHSPCFEGTLFTFRLEKSPCCIYRVKAILVKRQWITQGGVPSDHGHLVFEWLRWRDLAPLCHGSVFAQLVDLLDLHTFSLMSEHKARKYHLVRDGYLWMRYIYRKKLYQMSYYTKFRPVAELNNDQRLRKSFIHMYTNHTTRLASLFVT